MKKITFWMMLTFFGTTFFISSCGDDTMEELEEIIEDDPVITASNFVGDLDEVTNPDTQTEDFVIGTLSASVDVGTLSFSITSQTPSNALKVDADGVLKTNDFSGWDYETNTEVTAVIEAKAGSVTKDIAVTIAINNITEEVSFAGGLTAIPTIAENSMPTSHVSQYIAQTDGEIDYTISPDDYFRITNEGKIFLKDDVNLDYETITANGASNTLNYTITAFAIGQPELKDETTFKAKISDVEGDNETEERLAAGQTPAQIVAVDASFEADLYGATYNGGIIATFNSATGGGLIMTIDGVGTDRNWSQSNTYANNLVKGGYSDWRLMTEPEADVMCNISNTVSEDNYSGFWTSTNCGGICYNWKNFSNNNACGGGGSPYSQVWSIVRAVRAY